MKSTKQTKTEKSKSSIAETMKELMEIGKTIQDARFEAEKKMPPKTAKDDNDKNDRRKKMLKIISAIMVAETPFDKWVKFSAGKPDDDLVRVELFMPKEAMSVLEAIAMKINRDTIDVFRELIFTALCTEPNDEQVSDILGFIGLMKAVLNRKEDVDGATGLTDVNKMSTIGSA